MDDALENTPFLGDSVSEDKSFLKLLGQQSLNLLISITVGLYAGFSCRSMQEAWIYATIFCAEGLICSISATFIKTYSIRKALTSFCFYFVLSGIISPSCCWLCFKFA